MDLPKINEDMLHLMEPLTASEDIAVYQGKVLINSLMARYLTIIIIVTLEDV